MQLLSYIVFTPITDTLIFQIIKIKYLNKLSKEFLMFFYISFIRILHLRLKIKLILIILQTGKKRLET